MRDYVFGFRKDCLVPVARLSTADVEEAVRLIEAGEFERVSDEAPTPECMLERLRLELLARRLGM